MKISDTALSYQPLLFYGKNLNPLLFSKILKLIPPSPLLKKEGGSGGRGEGGRVPTMMVSQ